MLVVAGTLGCGRSARAQIRADEEVIFYPSYGARLPGETDWRLEVRGWIFEPEKDSLTRATTLALFREYLDLDRDSPSMEFFEPRARAFLVDNERGKTVTIRLGERRFRLAESSPDGLFSDTLRLAPETVEALRRVDGKYTDILTYEAELPAGDTRRFTGSIYLIGSQGLSVISDIDDTIKITEVQDREALLANTFLREFEAVPGMAALYRAWAAAGARFHYVSASPWQLYEPLAEFLQTAGFPVGTFHLKPFRWKHLASGAMFESPEAHKREAIKPILDAFPRRRFILVGDSGEKDPEIYGAIAREYPRQIERIFIRNVTDEAPDTPRFREAFADLERGQWVVFDRPESLAPITTRPATRPAAARDPE